MALLNDNVKKQIKQVFAGLEGQVKLVMFTQSDDAASLECQMCSDTRTLLEEVSALDDRITLEVHDFVKEEDLAKQYKIDKIPAVAVLGQGGAKDYGIRLYGIPSGYEFSSLIEDILLAGKGTTDLNKRTLERLSKLTEPVHIQVFITPT
jgi:glutaredoxin-like protein